MAVIATTKAPAALGPYSQAILAGNTVYLSGQVAIDPAKGVLVQDSIEKETEQIMKNLGAVLAAAGCSYANVVKTTIFATDIKYFDAVNGVYASYFTSEPPARSFVQAAALPKGARVEIEAVAVKS